MLHKLTIAIFPSPDKLIRCMLGPTMEELFGNRQSLPQPSYSPKESSMNAEAINTEPTPIAAPHDWFLQSLVNMAAWKQLTK